MAKYSHFNVLKREVLPHQISYNREAVDIAVVTFGSEEHTRVMNDKTYHSVKTIFLPPSETDKCYLRVGLKRGHYYRVRADEFVDFKCTLEEKAEKNTLIYVRLEPLSPEHETLYTRNYLDERFTGTCKPTHYGTIYNYTVTSRGGETVLPITLTASISGATLLAIRGIYKASETNDRYILHVHTDQGEEPMFVLVMPNEALDINLSDKATECDLHQRTLYCSIDDLRPISEMPEPSHFERLAKHATVVTGVRLGVPETPEEAKTAYYLYDGDIDKKTDRLAIKCKQHSQTEYTYLITEFRKVTHKNVDGVPDSQIIVRWDGMPEEKKPVEERGKTGTTYKEQCVHDDVLYTSPRSKADVPLYYIGSYFKIGGGSFSNGPSIDHVDGVLMREVAQVYTDGRVLLQNGQLITGTKAARHGVVAKACQAVGQHLWIVCLERE